MHSIEDGLGEDDEDGWIALTARLGAAAQRHLEKIRRYLETVSFGAKEATIFSKRGSPRKGSHIGLKRKLP